MEGKWRTLVIKLLETKHTGIYTLGKSSESWEHGKEKGQKERIFVEGPQSICIYLSVFHNLSTETSQS